MFFSGGLGGGGGLFRHTRFVLDRPFRRFDSDSGAPGGERSTDEKWIRGWKGDAALGSDIKTGHSFLGYGGHELAGVIRRE